MFHKKKALAATILGLAVLTTATPVAAATPKTITLNPAKGVYMTIVGNCDLPQLPGIQFPELQLPELPENNCPEKPALPELPVLPERPELPENPGTPEQPEIPEVPGVPERPEKPERPEEDEENTENSFAMQVIKLVNKERAKEGLPELRYDAKIEKAALVRAKETVASFSHTRPDGSSFSTALKEQGVSYRGAGENIAWGQKTPEEVMEGWMNSPGHRANIMNKNFTKIGVGYYQNAQGRNYWTQLFVN